MLKQLSQILVGYILGCFLPLFGYEGSVQERIQSIPKEDREILEGFFSYMVSYDYFGFVLFGEKPMAAGGFDTQFSIENTLSEDAMKQRRLHLGWRTWEKYASLFPSDKFILRLSQNPVAPSFYWIVLINKESCLKCIETNLDVFKSVLGDSAAPLTILNHLATKENIFNDVLKNHDGLLGILFGYGRYNAMCFQSQKRLSAVLRGIYPKGKGPSMAIDRLNPFNLYSRDLFVVDLPRFAGVRGKHESSQLRLSYEKTWVELSQIYASRNFLEVSLEKLISNDAL